jgi:hypothetical protein
VVVRAIGPGSRTWRVGNEGLFGGIGALVPLEGS